MNSHSRARHAIRVTAMACLVVLGLAGCGEAPSVDKARFTVGLITNNPNGLQNIAGFRDGMKALGYVEGTNIEYLFTGEPTARHDLESALQTMLARPLDLIFTTGTPTGVAAWHETRVTGVPVVFGVMADPIEAGVMTDLTRPGGNITGVKLSNNQDRRLQYFLELSPAMKRIVVPFNPLDAAPRSAVAQIAPAAAQLGVELVLAEVTDDAAVTALLASFPPHVDGVFLVPDSTVNRRLSDILDITEARGIPLTGPSIAQVQGGALMTYGFVHKEVGAQAAGMAHRILGGAQPGTLPVETAEFFLIVNLAAAARIGLHVTDDMLQRADVVTRQDRRST